MRATHWKYIKKSGKYEKCPKCGDIGYVCPVQNFDGSITWRTIHNEGHEPRTCWGVK